MKLASMPLVLLVLLGATGCMSVPASTEAPAPVAPVPSRTFSAQPAAVVPSAPPAAQDVLGAIEEMPPKKRDGRGTVKHRTSDRRAGATAPPVRADTPDEPRRYAPAHPRPRGPVVPRGARPHPTYDMRSVCAAGQGVTSGEIAELCRSTYGQ